MKALGCHVFAGGFTAGVQSAMPCDMQLEVHGLGVDTAPVNHFVCCDADEWPEPPTGTALLFGNPRCTGFSCLSGGCEKGHGPWSHQTIDIHQFMAYGTEHGVPVLCWESVQQAYTVGRPLLDYLVEKYCRPNGYRVAHVFLNAASFGNAQDRKRYFFVAYPRGKRFNLSAPPLVERRTTVADVICTPEFEQYKTRPANLHSLDYDADCWHRRSPTEMEIIRRLPQSFDFNKFADWCLDEMPDHYARKWMRRTSKLPFSLHSPFRLAPEVACPVISSSAIRYVHPWEDRCLTVREVARLMGWPPDMLPKGDHPIGQIGKGVVPIIGDWIARQVIKCLKDEWGTDDWETSYDARKRRWVGTWLKDEPLEKTMNVTKYAPPRLSKRSPDEYLSERDGRLEGRAQ